MHRGTDADGHRPVSDREMLAHMVADTLQHRRSLRLTSSRQPNDELFATCSVKAVGVAQHLLDRCRESAQDFIARLVAKGVVDPFEVIQIEHRQDACRDRAGKGSQQLLLQEPSVPHPRQRVAQTHVLPVGNA